MVIICARCNRFVPDSFHDYTPEERCTCKTKAEFIAEAKKMKWNLKIDGEEY